MPRVDRRDRLGKKVHQTNSELEEIPLKQMPRLRRHEGPETTFKITIWKVIGKEGDSLGQSNVVSSVILTIPSLVQLYMWRTFFSHDGRYIFILLCGGP
jgi:hypothetical protein